MVPMKEAEASIREMEQTIAMVGKLLENKKRHPGAQPQDVKMPAILKKNTKSHGRPKNSKKIDISGNVSVLKYMKALAPNKEPDVQN